MHPSDSSFFSPVPLTLDGQSYPYHDDINWTSIKVAIADSPIPQEEQIHQVWQSICSKFPFLKLNYGFNRNPLKTQRPFPQRWPEFGPTQDLTPPLSESTTPASSPSPSASPSLPPVSEHEDRNAYITLEKGDYPGASSTLTLHIRRDCINETLLGLIKQEFGNERLLGEQSPPAETPESEAPTDVEASKSAWRSVLDGAVFKSAVPWKRHLNESVHARDTKARSLHLNKAKMLKLHEFETAYNVSRRVLFEALWALVLYHHSGSSDILFATAEKEFSMSRPRRRNAPSNQTYPIRISVRGESTLQDLAASVKSFHEEMAPHASLSLDEIKTASEVPEIESLLSYSQDTMSHSAKHSRGFALAMQVSGVDDIHLVLDYSRKVDRHDAQVLLDHYCNVIQGLLSATEVAELRLDSIELASQEERDSVICQAQNASPIAPTNIAAMFEERVRATPAALALQFEEQELQTFDQLNRLANQIARAANIRKGTIVPLCMDRSPDFIACILAILKAGAAYVILDPDSSPARNSLIVAECDAELVFTHRRVAANFEQSCVVEDLLSNIRNIDLSVDDSNLSVEINSEDPCYIVYTSGSTGRPKGVVLSHRAATNGIAHYSLKGKNRWLLFFNPIFSAAQRTVLATLVHGGTLLLASKEKLTSSLGSVINEMKVDALGITTSALSLISPPEVPTLKQITLVGELIPQETVETWSDHVELRNTFGLSECTQLNFGSTLLPGGNPRVVGRPSDTTSAYVLQPETTKLAPLGTVGELCLSGPQLSSGYLKNPEQTAKVFIDNPFGEGKLYRTGDSARQHGDGSIEIVGRIDFQIKLNGQRVEPKEVDAAIVKSGVVKACATVAATMDGRKALVAGIVLKEGKEWREAISVARQHVQKLLPAYMVPSLWMPLESIPVNANGKTDAPSIRKRAEELRAEHLRGLLRTAYAGGSEVLNETEIAVRNAWAEIFRVPVNSIHRSDSFSMLGGDSLQAIRVVMELRKQGIVTALGDILGSASLEEAAKACQFVESEADEDPKPFSLLKDAALSRQDLDVIDCYPATPFQESLIAATQKGETMYTYQRVWDMHDVDVSRLRKSFEAVMETSDLLRTSFVSDGKGLYQTVMGTKHLPWSESEQPLHYFLEADKMREFPLGGLFWRLCLLKGEILVVTMHHALFDFWSHRFLYQDVAASYFSQSIPKRAPFKRFVKYLAQRDEAKEEGFWRNYLSEAEPTILNHSPVAERTNITKTLDFDLRQKATSLKLTTGSVVYTAWAIILARHLNSQDVSFVTTLSGRDAPVSGIGSMDGPTMATVPQRILINPEQSVIDLTRSVHRQLFQLSKYSQYGMRRILSAAGRQAPYFDTLINILVNSEESGDAVELFKRHGERPIWDSEFTSIDVEESNAGVTLRLSTRMESRRALYLLDSLSITMQAILEKHEDKVASLEVIGSEETAFISNELSNRNTLVVPEPALLHSLFENEAAKTPNAVAIDWNSERVITYQELDGLANQLAAFLIEKSVCVGDVVALMLDKSVNTIIAILGTMKAGAAYVPLNPDAPVDRNAFIIQDVKSKLLLAHRTHAEQVEQLGVPAVYVDDLDLSDYPSERPVVEIHPEGLAYVIYTSGSTGKPKGVQVPHRAAEAAVLSMLEVEGRRIGEWRTLQFANYVFDASVQDIFNTLSSGGTLCMAPTEDILSDLTGVINKMNVKQAILTPTVAKLFKPNEVPSFTTLIVGGEPLTPDVVAAWAEGHQILNVYGPTETSMVVTTKDVKRDGSPRNIGSPFPTVTAFLLQPDGDGLVPYGAVGELCIGGPQVTAGYVNASGPNSFVKHEKLGVEHMYRTGDLARWLPGQELECLGRKDYQIKIHGHRIEIGEIEQVLLQSGAVHDAVVILADVNGNPQLIAFAIFKAIAEAGLSEEERYKNTISEIKQGLSMLAPYMVPKAIVPVESWTKLPSGKVDRKFYKRQAESMSPQDLAQYCIDTAGQEHKLVAVSTEEERVLEGIWSEIFNMPAHEIGSAANFFSLGGDSISAINMVSACRKAGYETTVSQVLKYPVLGDLAVQLVKKASTGLAQEKNFVPSEEVLEEIERCGLSSERDIDYVYPCPPGQVEFLNQGKREGQFWVLTTVRKLPPSNNLGEWIRAVVRLTEVNDILRTSWLQTSDSEWVGVVLKSSTLVATFHNWKTQEERERIIEETRAHRFVFGKPFIRYDFLFDPAGQTEVIIKMDHAVYDGTLFRIFDDHFSAIQRGAPIQGLEQFRDYATWMWQEDKTASMKFWADFMRGKNFVYPAVEEPRITKFIVKEVSTNLESVTRACSVTPSIVFQAAFQLWLAKVSGQTDVSFDYLLSGRNVPLPNPQQINGTLANFLPFRSRISEDATMAQYLEATQSAFWEITEHGNVGLDAIYRAADVSRQQYGNKTLFLFQPFEPATGAPTEEMKWVVMAKSQVWMYQPYGLVIEVSKTLTGHKIKVMYDETVYSKDDAERIGEQHVAILESMVTDVNRRIGNFL